MRLKTPKPIRLIALAGIALFIGSCAKNTTIIYGSGEDDSLPETPQKGTTLVAFNASIESRNLTRAMSPMKKGIKSTIYAYQKSQSTTTPETLFAEGLYITSSPGVLSGNDGYKSILPTGFITFMPYPIISRPYLLRSQDKSRNLCSTVSTIFGGAVADQDVNSAQINIPIVFQHACTQVVIEVSAGDGVRLSRLLSATITPPVPKAKNDTFQRTNSSCNVI